MNSDGEVLVAVSETLNVESPGSREVGVARRGAVVAPMERHFSQAAVVESYGSLETDLWAAEPKTASFHEEEEVRRSHAAAVESFSLAPALPPRSYSVQPLQISKNEKAIRRESNEGDDLNTQSPGLSPLQALFDQCTELWARGLAGEGDDGEDETEGNSNLLCREASNSVSMSEFASMNRPSMISSPVQTHEEREEETPRSEKAESKHNPVYFSVATEDIVPGMLPTSTPEKSSTVDQNPWVNNGRESSASDSSKVVQDHENAVSHIDLFASLDVEGLIDDPGPAFTDLDLKDADWELEPHPYSSCCWCHWCDVARHPELAREKHDVGDWCKCLDCLVFAERKELEMELRMEESEARSDRIEMQERQGMEKRSYIENEGPVDAGINEDSSAKIKMHERQASDMETKLFMEHESPVDAGIHEDTLSEDDAHLDAGISEDPSPKAETEERNAKEIEKEAENEFRVDAGIDESLEDLDLRPGRFSAFIWRLRRLWSGPPASAPSLPLKEGK